MKKIFLVLLFCTTATVFAQEQAKQHWLWPISGAKSGTNILSTPQSYIDGQLNFDNLYIGAKLGDVVVAPTDGVINYVSILYMTSMMSNQSYGYDSKGFTYSIASITPKVDKSIDTKYLSGSLSITVGNGINLYISGLTGDKAFKTGQRIKRGDTLGYVGYVYNKIKEPAIDVSVSLYTKPADPMSPFGIKSSFIGQLEIKPIVSLTKAQAKEDFLIYINTLKEVYPGLYNVLTPQELEQYVAKTTAQIDTTKGDVKYDDFRRILGGAVAKIHDSHISLYPRMWDKPGRPDFQPQVFVGWINDTLRCTLATKQYANLVGKQVVKINGMTADSARQILVASIDGYDSKVKQYVEFKLATNVFGKLCNNKFDMSLEFADGQKAEILGGSTKNGGPHYTNNWMPFFNANRHRSWYNLKMVNDSTAYIGLTTFELNQVQVEDIARFIDSVAAVPNLIVDVRNNGGGNVEPLEKLYSHIAGAPIKLNGYCKVNKKGHFEYLEYSMNYKGVGEIFSEYTAKDGKDGFYYQENINKIVAPDSTINYKGRVYVLTNENSISAATLFPALLVRNHRGVVVGRETRTAYHFMNAMKFAEMQLPNSLSIIRIPLVECVFDTAINQRVPFGRGVIPDYIVPISLGEMNFTNGDAILNYTLKLIEQGQYLTSEDPFAALPAAEVLRKP